MSSASPGAASMIATEPSDNGGTAPVRSCCCCCDLAQNLDARRSSQSGNDRQRLMTGRYPVTGKAICCRARKQLYRDLGRTSYPLRDVGEGGQQGHTDGHFPAHQEGEIYRTNCISP